MSQVFIRDKLVEAFEMWSAANPSVPVFYEDTSRPDLDNVATPFVHVAFEWVDDMQIELAAGPGQRVRTIGFMDIRVLSREGAGSRSRLVIAESIKQHFARRSFGGVQVQTPRVRTQEETKGWMALPIVISFYRDAP